MNNRRIYNWQYRRLKKLERKLIAKGIKAKYRDWEVIVYLPDGREARFGHLAVGPASNGERLYFRNLIIKSHDNKVEEWFSDRYRWGFIPGQRKPNGDFETGIKRVMETAT